MKRIVVRLSGMPFDPTYEIDDDTIAAGDPCEYPAATPPSSRTARSGPSSPWEARIRAKPAQDAGPARNRLVPPR